MAMTDSCQPTPYGQLERRISRFLFWGGLLSLSVVTLGMVAYLSAGALTSSYLIEILQRPDRSAAGTYVSIGQIVSALRSQHDPIAVIEAGLLLLMALPAAAVALTIPGFIKARDFRFTFISFIILLIICLGILSGGRGAQF